MGQPLSPILLVAMAEGKSVLEGLRSATKCPSLEVTHITSAPNPLVRIVT